MKVLVAFETSQIVTEAFIIAGHDAMSCDYYEGEKGYPHYKGNVFDLEREPFDLIVGHPPCTFLTKAQLFMLRDPERLKKAEQALADFKRMMQFNSRRIALENPQGILQKWYRMYDQQVQPWQFGDPYRKDICLWLKGLPLLKPTEIVQPTKSRKNQTNGRMNQEQKSKIKSRFYPGIARAMAEQWGSSLHYGEGDNRRKIMGEPGAELGTVLGPAADIRGDKRRTFLVHAGADQVSSSGPSQDFQETTDRRPEETID